MTVPTPIVRSFQFSIRSMLRKFLAVSMSLALCFSAAGCGGGAENASNPGNRPAATRSQAKMPDGKYPVQQATFDDGNGEYAVALLNTPAGAPSTLRTENLQLARLSDEQVKAGEKAYLQVQNGQNALYIPEDFKIEYVHNVTEETTNPQTGQRETVVVRQEPSFWSPFAGALAGQAIGSLLFRPQYYVPPVYQTGAPLSGFGGYGNSYGQAVSRYQERYNAPPAVERNRQVFRSTGRLNSPGYRNPRVNRPSINNGRPSGSGFGSSNLRRSNGTTAPRVNRPSSFGSGRARTSGARRR